MGRLKQSILVVLAAGLAACSFLAGCSVKQWLNHAAPETTAKARSEFDALRHRQYDRIVASFGSGLDLAEARPKLDAMAALVPAGEPLSVKTVGAHMACDSRKGCDYDVTLEYQFSSAWMLVELTDHQQDGKSEVTNFHVQQLGESLEEINRFTLIGKSAVQCGVLLMALGMAGVTLWALVLCIRTPMARLKWLWILFILVGFGRMDVDWTTGEASYRIAHVLLFSSGFYGMPYGSWTIMFGIPVGALLFLILRQRLRKRETPAPPVESAPPASTVA